MSLKSLKKTQIIYYQLYEKNIQYHIKRAIKNDVQFNYFNLLSTMPTISCINVLKTVYADLSTSFPVVLTENP